MKEEKIYTLTENMAGAVWERPFADDETIAVCRHGKGGKWFGILLNAPARSLGLAGENCVRVLNVKCDPPLAALLIENRADIFPGYHMNKTHWISLRLQGELADEEFEKLLNLSYMLTLPKACRKID